MIVTIYRVGFSCYRALVQEQEPVMVASSIKVIGSNGQISLGKKYAGRQVLVEEQEPGVWLIRTSKVVPDNEAWVHEPETKRRLERALKWAASTPPDDSNVDEILARLSADD